jgi:excisionase family DNA binding protein
VTVPDRPDLLSILEACKLLGISDDLGYQLANAGRFPGDAAIKIGGRWRVSKPVLERHLLAARSPTADKPDLERTLDRIQAALNTIQAEIDTLRANLPA